MLRKAPPLITSLVRTEDTTFLGVILQSYFRAMIFCACDRYLVKSARFFYTCGKNPLLTVAMRTKRLIR